MHENGNKTECEHKNWTAFEFKGEKKEDNWAKSAKYA